MTSMRKYAGSSFIRLEDVKARPIRATIVEVTEGDYGRPVLRLDSGQRFTVNATNMRTLIAAFGEDDADLINKRIELFAGFTKYQGNEQESVLVKAVSPGKGPAPKQERTKPSDDMDDLIPF